MISENEGKNVDNIKYAVSVYGIRQDPYRDENGDTGIAGLTFGPASGADFTNNYVSVSNHGADHSGVTASGNPHRCIHNDSWEEIIEWSRKDPCVYERCVGDEEHLSCTKTVPLMLSQKLRGEAYPDMSGDGASLLYHSIHHKYRQWNCVMDHAGGWPASRIRATLNGRSSDTDEFVAGTDCLTAGESLFAAFPKEMQSAIVAKAVKSDTVHGNAADHCITTYDRLWLLSCEEYWDENGIDCCDNTVRQTEGALYQRQAGIGIVTDDCRKAMLYAEYGGTYNAWLRSVHQGSVCLACYVVSTGDRNVDSVSNSYGIAPGFCIK